MGELRKVCDEKNVSLLYEDKRVAETYVRKRFAWSWSNLLHCKQVGEVQRVLRESETERILEIAPGPARIAVDLSSIQKGLMVENSEEMIELAKERLKQFHLDSVWDIVKGNAFELENLNLEYGFLYTFRFVRHFKLHDRERLYRAFSASLKPKGLLMLDVVNSSVRKRLDLVEKGSDELDVYDVGYSGEEFEKEMNSFGFDVVSLVPVVHYFDLQSWISYTFDSRIKLLSSLIVNLLEKIPTNEPLEWIALCRKKH